MSSNDMPELGSKISLISKADIRYEGKLYTVDPQDCTIALANVRSFGTEDRKTSHPVPAQNQVYDYILFRATDIKDISVVPPTQLLCDPAIVQLSSSIGNRYGGSQPGGQDYPPMLSGLYGPSGGGQSGGFNPMQSGLHPLASRQQPQSEFTSRTLSNSESVVELLIGSRSSTPGLRKPSPTVDQGTQANARQKDNRNPQMMGGRMNQDHRGDNKGRPGQPSQQRTRTYQQVSAPESQQGGSGGRGWQNQQQNMNRQQHPQQQRNNRLRLGGGRQFARAPGPRPKSQPTQPLKFESDYDFDKANSEFEELKSEISKLKLNDNGEAPAPLMNGDSDKKDDSGTETAIVTDTEGDEQYFYNKSKSFFDNISCEAIERSKGRSQRTDWRKERMLNSETFGVATARRGNYRGGRGGGGFFFGGGGRGGGGYYQRGYRGQQGQRYRSSKSPAQRQPQQTQVAST
ncbi:unnamed protein product [Nezara viridula]|uniref:Protein LSM14 homolog B n=1 Tax=Nezara viridula TaxID=85310 RepID=A0A9P0HCZ5_NEZVI|nr:unnamed protein product [Nezara viridula]